MKASRGIACALTAAAETLGGPPREASRAMAREIPGGRVRNPLGRGHRTRPPGIRPKIQLRAIPLIPTCASLCITGFLFFPRPVPPSLRPTEPPGFSALDPRSARPPSGGIGRRSNLTLHRREVAKALPQGFNLENAHRAPFPSLPGAWSQPPPCQGKRGGLPSPPWNRK